MKFQAELPRLSARARKVLANHNILLFDFFYEHYFTKLLKINFNNCRNCGQKTAEELDHFVDHVCSLEGLFIPLNEEIKKKFEFELSKLSARGRNTLEDQGLLLFNFFYDQYFVQQNRINFKNCRNCGAKTAKELNQFVNEVCSVTVTHIPLILPVILKPQLLQNNPIVTPEFNFRTKLMFEIELK